MSHIRRQVNDAVKNMSRSKDEFTVISAQATLIGLSEEMNADERFLVARELVKLSEKEAKNEHDAMRKLHADYTAEQIALRSYLKIHGY